MDKFLADELAGIKEHAAILAERAYHETDNVKKNELFSQWERARRCIKILEKRIGEK